MSHTARGALVGAGLVLMWGQAAPALCARLPVHGYTTAEGLAHDRVESVRQDSRGFLWFGTAEGLSRFDGFHFTTFGVENGLPRGVVTDVAESGGQYWIATEAGLCVLRAPLSLCETRAVGEANDAAARRVNAVLRDSRGRLWAGTDSGLFHGESRPSDPLTRVALPMPEGARPRRILALAEGPDGSVWFGGQGGLWRALPDDRVLHYDVNWTERHLIFSILVDGDRAWIGHLGGMTALSTALPKDHTLRPPLHPLPAGCERRLSSLNAGQTCLVFDARGPAGHVLALARSADGTIWAGTRNFGLFEVRDGRLQRHTADSGLASNAVHALHEDRDGNLWIGTEGRGVMKLARRGLVSYGRDDGLRNTRIISVFGDRAGEPYLLTGAGFLHRFAGGGWSSAVEPLRRGVRGPFAFGTRLVLQDHAGSWWMGTGWALFRFDDIDAFAKLDHLRPSARVTADPDNGPALAGPLLEDARGDIWAGSLVGTKPCLLRWQRSTQTSRTYALPADLASGTRILALAADTSGSLWIGLAQGGLVRLRDGRVERVDLPARPAATTIRAFHLDGNGRLWMAADNAGLGRIDHPQADHPESQWWGRNEGLASDAAYCLTADRWGRVYVGTALGVTRLDADGGHMRHYGIADGLSASEVRSAFTDRQGRLWFGTTDGVSALTPVLEPPASPPAPYIAQLRVAGVARPVSILGETAMDGLDLAPEEAHVEIEYGSLAFGLGERLRYRHRLEGAGDDWSAPSDRRMVSYEHLAPGTYRFAVQAIAADGTTSTAPASVAFRVRPPLWQRAWFLAAVVGSAALLAYAAFRYRLAMLVEVERVRLRVASDLHDDIGSNLSKIAILSEVAHRQEPSAREASLTQIADMARQLVDSMSDIVWAVNPSRDSLRDLTQRMRGFATELFSAIDVSLRFDAPPETETVPIGADLRRQVFLVFKEVVTNAAAHGHAKRVEVELRVDRGILTLRVTDDGRGFDAQAVTDGHGLHSVRERARALRGTIEIHSEPGRGTTVLLRAPLRPRPGPVHYLSA